MRKGNKKKEAKSMRRGQNGGKNRLLTRSKEADENRCGELKEGMKGGKYGREKV